LVRLASTTTSLATSTEALLPQVYLVYSLQEISPAQVAPLDEAITCQLPEATTSTTRVSRPTYSQHGATRCVKSISFAGHRLTRISSIEQPTNEWGGGNQSLRPTRDFERNAGGRSNLGSILVAIQGRGHVNGCWSASFFHWTPGKPTYRFLASRKFLKTLNY